MKLRILGTFHLWCIFGSIIFFYFWHKLKIPLQRESNIWQYNHIPDHMLYGMWDHMHLLHLWQYEHVSRASTSADIKAHTTRPAVRPNRGLGLAEEGRRVHTGDRGQWSWGDVATLFGPTNFQAPPVGSNDRGEPAVRPLPDLRQAGRSSRLGFRLL